jgi:cyclic pyranopterin phosphate synthase
LSHVDAQGKANMVDVSAKPRVRRSALARGAILLQPATVELIRQNRAAKGDVLATARVAGIMAGKRTAELIPLCHGIAAERIAVELELLADRVEISALALCTEKTGIEMEALTAVSVAALTVFDMVKAVDKTMRIEGIELVHKTKTPLSTEGAPSGPTETFGTFQLVSLNLSERKGTRKTAVSQAEFVAGHGLAGDAHAGDWHRQVSLLAEEAIDEMRAALPGLVPGDFAENVTTRGVDWAALPVGARIAIGEVELEITQIGKECHGEGCAIRRQAGDCVMPRRGVFARVLQGGIVNHEDRGHYRF